MNPDFRKLLWRALDHCAADPYLVDHSGADTGLVDHRGADTARLTDEVCKTISAGFSVLHSSLQDQTALLDGLLVDGEWCLLFGLMVCGVHMLHYQWVSAEYV